MLKMYCDLCGKPLSDNKSRNFKIKELKVSWHESWWQRIDAHDECVKKIFDSVKKERIAMDIRRDVPGLWCDDITFCPDKCGWKDCPRNKENIRDRTIPHSFSVEIPQDCPKKESGMR